MSKRGRPKGRSADSRSFGPLGDLIRSHRLAKGLGLADVAKACGCSVQFISNIEHGRAPLPWEKAPLLANFLGLSLEALQAANLSIRSDFKSFVNLNDPTQGGARSSHLSETANPGLTRGVLLKSGRKKPKDQSSQALALAIAAKDAGLQEILEAYQLADLPSRKRFLKSAIKLLQSE
jgi:transcriptional regulator with XRE-family HTH domain